jgi:two-component system, OmpR family, sensor histidine kinase PrrB
MSLRARIALSAALASAIVMIFAAVLIVRLTESDQRATLDKALNQQAHVLSGPLTRIDGSRLTTLLDRSGASAIDGDRTIQVLTATGGVKLSFGPALPGTLRRTGPGASTVVLGGKQFRVYAIAGGINYPLIARRTGAAAEQVQIIAPLAPLRAQARSIRRRVLIVSAGAVIAIVVMAWLLTGAALTSLRSLRKVADEVATTDDLTRRLEPLRPPEIGAVVDAFNAMLGRLHVSSVERAQALDTARSFAADAMHELRTPLTSMGANLEALQQHPDVDREQLTADLLSDHARIVAALEALNALTVAETAASPVEPLDLADLVDVISHEAPRRHPGLTVSVELPADSVQIAGSREAMRMVLDNLLSNAERHGREGGAGPVRVDITIRRSGDDWVLTVADDGVGFPQGDGDRLLGRFERGTSLAPGSGLGLAIVAQQVRRHGGSIALGRSTLGGANVEIRLPVSGMMAG